MATFIMVCTFTILYLIAFQLARLCLKDKEARILLAIVFWVILFYVTMNIFGIFMEDLKRANYNLFDDLLTIVYNSIYWPSILGLISLAALILVLILKRLAKPR